jgi:hypothetical protein
MYRSLTVSTCVPWVTGPVHRAMPCHRIGPTTADHSLVRTGYAPRVMATLRNLAQAPREV